MGWRALVRGWFRLCRAWRESWPGYDGRPGDRGERLAARYLRRLGYRIVARRYRTALGELDLIAADGACIVFVEVKTRTSAQAGHPAEAVDARKQQQLSRLATAFLKRTGRLHQRARFDVISVLLPAAGAPVIQHYQNAFEPPDCGQMFS